MPAILIDINLVWQIINFCVIMFIFKKKLFGPVSRIISERKALITKDMDDARIDKENAEVIFEKFKQIQNVLTRDVGGTGLGLPICKRIIEEHYGKIWVESEKNKKTIFKILLPIVK